MPVTNDHYYSINATQSNYGQFNFYGRYIYSDIILATWVFIGKFYPWKSFLLKRTHNADASKAMSIYTFVCSVINNKVKSILTLKGWYRMVWYCMVLGCIGTVEMILVTGTTLWCQAEWKSKIKGFSGIYWNEPTECVKKQKKRWQ